MERINPEVQTAWGEKGRRVKGADRGKGNEGWAGQNALGEIPQRYCKADERGEKGIEGARYIIVELPDTEGASEVSVTSKSRKELRGSKVPVSNVPLPPRSGRDAPLGKQRFL